MLNESKPLRFLLRSPLLLAIFIIIPAALIISSTLHIPLPFRITQRILLFNNVGLLLFLVARLFYYLAGLRHAIRYGKSPRPSTAALTSGRNAAQIQDELTKNGFLWNIDNSYGEKHDRGYLGTILIYGGLFLLLSVGTYENMSQFSGTLLHGIGIPADLSKRGSYFPLIKGPLATTSGLPKLEVTRQIFASSAYPKGATDITLWSRDDKALGRATIIGAGEPYKYKGYDIFLAKQLVDVALNLRAKENPDKIIFYDSVKFSPLWKKEGGLQHVRDIQDA